MSILNEADKAQWKAELARLDKEDKKMLRGTLAQGMYFRRERYWKVFTWSSGIFAVLITGILIRGAATSFSKPFLPTILSIAATVLLVVANQRIRGDYLQVGLRAELIAEIDRELSVWIGDLEKKYRPKTVQISNRGILWILYIVLMVLVWTGTLFPALVA